MVGLLKVRSDKVLRCGLEAAGIFLIEFSVEAEDFNGDVLLERVGLDALAVELPPYLADIEVGDRDVFTGDTIGLVRLIGALLFVRVGETEVVVLGFLNPLVDRALDWFNCSDSIINIFSKKSSPLIRIGFFPSCNAELLYLTISLFKPSSNRGRFLLIRFLIFSSLSKILQESLLSNLSEFLEDSRRNS